MKKYLLSICVLTLLVSVMLTGCKEESGGSVGGGNTAPGVTAKDDIIFGGDFKVILPEGFAEEYSKLAAELDATLYELVGSVVIFDTDASDKYSHEIMIGNTGRPLSKKAYLQLDQLKRGDEELIGYVVYSDGDNIAVAYDSEESLEPALEALCEKYLTPDYGRDTVETGVLLSWSYDLADLYAERDAAIMAERFASLEKEVNEKGYDGKATVAAFKKLYGLYSDSIYLWMADLYDPVLGGFYYSNSGRNTVGFLPDIESTMQVLNLIRFSGMIGNVNEIPEELRESILEFVKSLQSSSDGYFYHPQWEGIEITDERRGRDQMWSIDIFKMFGDKPLYDTGGMEGTLGAPGAESVSHLTSPLKRDYKGELGRIIACATLDHLASEANFKAYLDSQDWSDSYTTGNRLAAQVTSINDAGLLDYCIEYLNSRQNPENGMWEPQSDDRAVNGFLKIGALYNSAGRVIPHSDAAADTCIKVLLSEEPAGTVCWVYNVWYALDIIITQLYNSNTPDNTLLADSIRDDLRQNAARYVSVAADKYKTFLKDDGTFSFTPDMTSAYSQGMPVAVIGTNEGDVNATYISSIGLTGYIFSALGYETVDLYTENDYKVFINRLEGLGEIVKTNTSVSGEIDFEKLTNLVDVFYGTNCVVLDRAPAQFGKDEASSAYAVLTGDSERSGQMLEFGKPDPGLEARIEIGNKSAIKSRYVFEFDMKFMGGEMENKSWHTRFALFNNSKRFWSLLVYTLDDGRLALGDRNEPLAVLDADEWYNIRFEYYTDTADRACKIYIDDVYICEGGSGDISNGDESISRAFIELRNEAVGLKYRFDNILVSSDDEIYIPPFVDAGDAIGPYYSDANIKGKRYDYDAEDAALPALLNNTGTLRVLDGRLHFGLSGASGGDTLIYELPISGAQAKFENLCKIFEFEFSYGNISRDKPISFLLGNQEYTLVKDAESGKLNIIDKYNGDKIIMTALAPDRVYVLRFECYAYADSDTYNITKLYVDNEYIGQLRSSYNTAVTKLGIRLDPSLAGSDAFVSVENVLIANIDREYVREESEGPDEGGDIETAEPSPFGGGVFYNGSYEGLRFNYGALVPGLQTDGVTSGSDDTAALVNGTLVYTRNNITGESYMRWNHDRPVGLSTPVFIFETDFRFDGFYGNTPVQKIIIQANGISHQINPSFALSGGVQTMMIGSMTLNEGSWYNIRFELDYEAGKIYYFLNGEYSGSDYLSKSTTAYQRVIWYYMAKQTGGSMTFDNTFEGLIEDGTICASHTDSDGDGKCDRCPLDIPKPPKPEASVPENTLGGGVFYNGSAPGNRFDCDSIASGIDIAGVGGADEVKTKDGHIRFIRNNDTGTGESYLRWNHSKDAALTTPVFVFETDFFFTGFAVGAQTAQKIVIEANGIRHQITPVIALDGKSMTIGKLQLNSDRWYNIRFEADYAKGCINYFLDGVYAGSEQLTSSSSGGSRVLWYYMAKQTDGTMVFDNTFEGLVEEGTPTETAPPETDTPETEPDTPSDPDSQVALGRTDERETTDRGGWL